jgi:cytochrome P450
MSEAKMRDELVTMLSDGPTATSLAWVFERLLAHPEKLRRLREEVDDGESEEYLDAVVKETLRLCPTVPVVMRRLAEPMEIAGHTIPDGTIVAPCVYLTHLREDLYNDRSASWRSRPAPTPGFPSEAAPGAAWRRASRRSRCDG